MAGGLKPGDWVRQTHGMCEVNAAIEVPDRGKEFRSIIRYERLSPGSYADHTADGRVACHSVACS